MKVGDLNYEADLPIRIPKEIFRTSESGRKSKSVLENMNYFILYITVCDEKHQGQMNPETVKSKSFLEKIVDDFRTGLTFCTFWTWK